MRGNLTFIFLGITRIKRLCDPIFEKGTCSSTHRAFPVHDVLIDRPSRGLLALIWQIWHERSPEMVNRAASRADSP